MKTPHQKARSQKIIESAARAFAKKGFHGTSIDDIVAEAGISVSSLYRYFRGKNELYRAVVDRIANVVIEPFDDPLLPSLAFRPRLEWVLRRQLRIIETHREFFVTFALDRASMDWELAGGNDAAGAGLRRWAQALEELARQGIDEGALKPLDPAHVAYLISGSFSATIFRWLDGRLDVPLQEYIPTLLDMIFGGIATPERER